MEDADDSAANMSFDAFLLGWHLEKLKRNESTPEKRSYNLDFNSFVTDTNIGYGAPNTHNSVESVCPNTGSFCFPSTLSGYSYKEKSLKEGSVEDSGSQYSRPFGVELTQDSQLPSNNSWSSDYGMFELLNGGVVSCSLNSREGINDVPSFQTESGHKDDFSSCGGPLLKQKTTHFLPKNSMMSESSSFSPNVRINPTLLDWGQKYMYSPSVAYITVENTCNDGILHLYEPFSTDIQFYPCNFSEVSLGPGESALISFVFFPRCLGLSSAHLILQTSYGGFFIEAKGYASESPYGVQPLLGLEISPGGRLSKNFSLFNSFDETFYVDEITAWISVSLGHNSVETEVICTINNFHAFDNILYPTIKDRLVVKSDQVGSPIVAIRPHRNWEVGPHSSETLIEIDISVGLEGKIFGSFCLHLLSSSQDKSDTIMVPIEAAVSSNSAHDTAGIYVSATLEALTPCDGGETVIIISIRNDAPYLSSFVKVVEVADTQIFHIKFMEGLLLFPNTVTQVAIIYCSHLRFKLHDLPPEVSNLKDNCKLLILTNDSTSRQIEIQCEDILDICFGHQRLSSVGLQYKSEYSESGDLRAGYVGGSMHVSPNVKVIETADVEELVLGNWVSQGTAGGMSVLEDREVLFPMVQVGNSVSQWITVKNPSQHPVIMQLVLNSGEIIDKCKGPDGLVRPSSSGNWVLDESATPKKYGFSVPETAITEAFVHPNSHVSLGPIIFYPSDRCGWSGSALIRNNLSGVEWLSLKGFGGSLSLVLFEKSEHVQSLDFNLKMPRPLNFSLSYALLHMKEMTSACTHSLVKEIYAKNTGDLPLEVIRIGVSGRECALDGFKVHSCRGFVLEPGESTKLLISYQTDFSAAMVHRDLEIALATGIFLIPMKASFPYDMLSSCKKSMFWMLVKKLLLGFIVVASLVFLVFCFIFPITTALGSMDHYCKSDNSSIPTTIQNARKTPLLLHSPRKSKLSMSDKMNNLLCSVEKDTTSYGQVVKGFGNNPSPPPRKAASKPVEIPSAGFPVPGEPLTTSSLALKSTVPPHARAPGSKLDVKKAVQAKDAGLADEYTYDIWGDHFSGLHLSVPTYVTPMKSSPAAENNFDSFFVKGPQTLMTISQRG
ncbi:Transmembrane protein [Senna tora]|uniref:Transmembrane protein n=1 Tax=Senna tora TaxID=362788 RepID=A0A834W658_9FABA|nr:Transmembrane protein [Senna tora]